MSGRKAQNFGFPFRVDHRGRTASAGFDRHIRELVEQLLFTTPGERVNRPDFGTELRRAVFAPNSEHLAAALEHMVQGALQRWLSKHIAVQAIEISAVDSALSVDIQYQVKRTQERRQVRLVREL